jgi:transcriptional regulator with XRE-family HTH domain
MCDFKDNLRRLRLLKRINQETLAKKIGVTQASISQYERGDRIPGKDLVKKISKILEIPLNQLMDLNKFGNLFLWEKIKKLKFNHILKVQDYVDYLLYKENLD